MENEMDTTEIEKSDTETSETETPETETVELKTAETETDEKETAESKTAETEKGVKSKYALLIGLGILIFALSFLYGMRFLQPKLIAKQLDTNPPPFGWVVTEDLGVGDVPGGPTAQRFVVENDTGWEVLAYCLEPDEPPPPVGAHCDLVDGDTFWCGDEYQLLLQYEIVQIPPPPAQTITSTRALTRTSTSTPTATATNTPTFTPTATNTATPTNTPSSTPTSTATNTPVNTAVPTQAFTPTPRPKMGGDGNLRSGDIVRLGIGIGLISISGVLAAIEGKRYLIKRIKK